MSLRLNSVFLGLAGAELSVSEAEFSVSEAPGECIHNLAHDSRSSPHSADMIIEPPSMGVEYDSNGHQRPVAIMRVRFLAF